MTQVAVRVTPSLEFKNSVLPSIDDYNEEHETFNDYHYITQSKNYRLLVDILGDDLYQLSDSSKTAHTAKLKNLRNYMSQFYRLYSLILHGYDDVVRELFLLHELAKSLDAFNENNLQLSNQKFRARILYPNVIYVLIRMCPSARKFLQNTIKRVYNEINRTSNSLIKAHASSIYLDKDVIKTDILYEFLGNGLRKLDPLAVNNLTGFYIKVFRNIFYYYFKKEQQLHASLSNVWDIHELIDQNKSHSPTRLSLYKDILYDVQVERMYKRSPTISQIQYNFNIFRNIVLNNEFQSLYFSTQTDVNLLDNDEYKLMKFYDDDLMDYEFIKEIKKLPIIYQLVRCIHLQNPNAKAYNEMSVKPEMVHDAIVEELMHPFKNFFREDVVYDIISQIAANFTTSILSGEYINPMTLSTTKINHVTFIIQLKKFINLCIYGVKSNAR